MTTDGLNVLGATKEVGASQMERSLLVVAALQAKHPRSIEVVRALTANGEADAAMYLAWGGPDARTAAHTHALADTKIPNAYLELVAQTGGDPILAAVQLAEQKRQTFPELGDAAALPIALAVVSRFGGVTQTHALAALKDNRIPNWLRVVISDKFTKEPIITSSVGEALSQWPDLVDAIRHKAGLPPSPGFDVSNRNAQETAIDSREPMLARHLGGMRAALHRSDLDEPAITVLLEILGHAGALQQEDLEALTADWKKRFFIKPADYTPRHRRC